MGRMCVADLEADGLLDQATQVWCGVFKDWHTKEVFKFTHVDEMLDFMSTCDILAMHNGVSYDWPLLEKLYGYTYEGKKIDTLLMSRLQNPERPLPLGCTKGPHSVEAWGMRFGRHKPEHEDWSKFSPEMLHRCTEDVEIQYLILKRLMEEGKGGAWKQANILTRDVFEILHKQEEYGWLVDKPYMEWCIEHLTKGINKLDRIVEPHLPYRITRPTKSGDTYAYYKNPFTKAGKYQHYITKWHDNAGYDPDHRIVGGPFSSVSFQKTDLGSDAQIKEYLLGEGWIPEQWNYSKKTGERTGPKLSKDESFEGVNR